MEILVALAILGAVGFVLAYFKYYQPKPDVDVSDIFVPVEPPNPVIEPPVEPKRDLIHEWALAIQEFEGWTPGSASYRRNNPGNLKNVNGTFKTFATYRDGMNALEDYLRRACTGNHRAYKPTYTLKQFFATYAPDGDVIVSNYASFVARRLGVPVDKQIKELV